MWDLIDVKRTASDKERRLDHRLTICTWDCLSSTPMILHVSELANINHNKICSTPPHTHTDTLSHPTLLHSAPFLSPPLSRTRNAHRQVEQMLSLLIAAADAATLMPISLPLSVRAMPSQHNATRSPSMFLHIISSGNMSHLVLENNKTTHEV